MRRVAALIFDGKFDLRNTYFLLAGIAGVDPAQGTLGSAHWARFAVDGGLQNEIDARSGASGAIVLRQWIPSIRSAS
jgi:purine nucleoside permease